MHRIVHEPHGPLAEWRTDLAPALGRIVRRCLEKDPNDRYQSMRDLALDLREVVNTEGRHVAERKSREQATGQRRLRWAVPLAIVALLAAGWVVQRAVSRSGGAVAAAERDAGDSVSQLEMSRLTNSGQTITAAISPDGNYLAHVRADGDKQSLWIKQVASGTYMQVIPPTVSSYSWLTVSDDGNYIYFARADFPEFNVNDVYRVPMLGGEVLRVVRNIEGDLAISPDGSRVAYARFDAEERIRRLYVSQSDGSGERLVLRRAHPDYFGPAFWNPDGKHLHLRVGKDVEDRRKLSEEEKKQLPTAVQLDVDSGVMTQARPERIRMMGESIWLPDGSGMIAKIFHREQPAQLYFVPEPDGRPRKITNDLHGYHSISVTADSSTIVAVRQERSSNLWIVDLANPRRPMELTRGQNHYALDGAPRWTPDGDLIVQAFDGRSALQLLSPEGKLIRTLTDEHNYALARLSPDGQQLAYITDRGGGQQIWVSSADGSNPRAVVTGRASFPSFLPDGRSIVYATGGSTQFAWKVSLDGGAPVQLTSKPTNMPVVSPDGRWLLCRYRAAEPGKPLWRTAIMSLESPGEPRFFDSPRDAGGPRLEWHPDSKHFGYVGWQGGVANVWLQSIEGGEPRQITFFDSGTINAFDWSRDGRQLVVAHVEGTSDAVMIRNFL
jgi:Tol biopolymer transport system component